MDEIPDSLTDPRPSPQQAAAVKERAEILHEALGRLPDHYRTPLVLAHVEGLAVEEVARVLNLPEGTIKSRLFRARAMLREILRRHYPSLALSGATGEVP